MKIWPATPGISLSNDPPTDREPSTADRTGRPTIGGRLIRSRRSRAAIAAVRAAGAERRWAYARVKQSGDDWTCILEDHKSIYIVQVDASSGGARVTRVNRPNRTVPTDENDTGP